MIFLLKVAMRMMVKGMTRASGYMAKGAMVGVAVGMAVGVGASCALGSNKKVKRYVKSMPKNVKNSKMLHTVEDLVSSISYAMK